MFNRRLFVLATAIGLSLPFHSALAQQWPERPIKFIVPSGAGGAADIVCRIFAAELEKQLKQPIIIDNKPGSGGVIGVSAIARSAPDGYTLGYGNLATLSINPALIKNLSYNVQKDLIPVAQFTYTHNLLVTRPGLQFKSLQELVDHIKSKPPKSVTFASSGVGTTTHLTQSLFEQTYGVDISHIPYKTSTQAHQDLLGNRVDAMFENINTISPHIKSGALKALAFTGKNRSPLFPDVPTMEELGVKGFVVSSWGGLIFPAGTPKAIVDRLNKEVNVVLQSQSLRDAYAKISGNAPPVHTQEEFANLVKTETERWAEIVKKAGVSLEPGA